jgi:hypothetical protein
MCVNRLLSIIVILGGIELLASRALAQQFGPRSQAAPTLSPFEASAVQILMEDPDPNRRRDAALSLGQRGSMAAVGRLASAAAYDPERSVRVAAGDAVVMIKRRSSGDWAVRPPAPTGYRQMVESWYSLYLNRAPDPTGVRDFVNRLSRGASPEDVQASIIGSDEYYQLHGSRPASWIAGMYADVLGRSARRDEISHWLGMFQRLGGSREQTALEFLRTARTELSQRR